MILYNCPFCLLQVPLQKADPRPQNLWARVEDYYVLPVHPTASIPCEGSGQHPDFTSHTERAEMEIALNRVDIAPLRA